MLRIIHTADVHLGARHDDLGEQASAQRERQFAAFKATIDLAIADKVDLVLIAGDLFDSNVQPRRSVERVAGELARLVAARIRTAIIPGTHDCYDHASIYRAYDLKTMAGSSDTDDLITVLTPDRGRIDLATIGAVVHGPVFATKRAPNSPLRDLDLSGGPAGAWHIGLVHGSIAIPGKTDRDDVVFTTDEIAASKLDYLALGHWHSAQQGRAGATTHAYAGAPEPVALDQDRAGKALLVTLDDVGGRRTVTVEERAVGRTTFQRESIDAATIASQPALIDTLTRLADPDRVLDVRVVGVRPDELDLDIDEIEAALASSFLKVRVRDTSKPALSEGDIPSPDTVVGAFIRDVQAKVTELEAAGSADEAAEWRDVLRLGRLLLAGHEVSL